MTIYFHAMKRKLLLKIFIGIAAFLLLLVLILRVVIEPWVVKKIETSFNTNSSDYLMKIDKLLIDKLLVEIQNDSTAQSYTVKDGYLKIYHLQIVKLDTLNPAILKQFDFDATEMLTVTPDSLYTFTGLGINYSGISNSLTIDSFSIQPNYSQYEFTERYQFQTNRIEVGLSAVHFYNFSIESYLKSKSLLGSYIEIGKLDVNSFRDKRKPFRHVNRPAFQDMIYNYPGFIQLDSIAILSGSITHTVHAEKANEPGFISFHQLNAQIFNITNDTIYKTEEGYLELKAGAMVMGKGKLNTLLKARLFDPQNTFTVNGTLSEMDIMVLNPILEKNVFIMATSGKIDALDFSFMANNTKAIGHLNMLYHGLKLTFKNKQTGNTTAPKEQIESMIANFIVIDSNPLQGEAVRKGVIDNQRDPERFLFHYSFKAILSGIKSVIIGIPSKKE
jgi:hypothetical protein